MKSLSLVIGSGFSVPDGIKTVREINDIIVNLQEEDIDIFPDMTFKLLDGHNKSTCSTHWADKKFFIHFIHWYLSQIEDDFKYDVFYDYITSFKRFGNNKNKIETFFEKFKHEVLKSNSPIDGINSYISRFSDYFNQLISNLLENQAYYEDVDLVNYPLYDRFSAFLKDMVDSGYIVNNHSLNHDLLFEHIASKHVDLFQHFTDGYTDLGSTYYGDVYLRQSISKNYKVRLKYFTNIFNKHIRLFKLHGSVDTYIANLAEPNLDLARVKKDWGVSEIHKEIADKDGKLFYTELFQNTYPDILSGLSSKAIWYQQPYYKDLQDHFKKNLSTAESLLVIGYSFGDDLINNIIETEYLTRGKKMIVIDINRPKNRLVNDYSAEVFVKSLSDMTVEDWGKIKNNCS